MFSSLLRRTGSRKATYRPRLECLEARWCPSCDVFQDGNILLICGDRAANEIAILDRGEVGILVTCADGSLGPFYSVNAILANTFAGNDRLRYAAVGRDTVPVDLRFDLGDGDDALRIDGPDLEGGSPSEIGPPYDWNVSFTTGAGNDAVTVSLCRIDGSVTLQGDLGDGNDRFDWVISVPVPLDLPRPPGPPTDPIWRSDVAGGRGDDRLHVQMDNPELLGERGRLTVPVAIGFLGQDGDDHCTVAIQEVDFAAGLTITADSGAGNDLLGLVMDRMYADGHVRVELTADQGADRALVVLTQGVLDGQFPVFVDTGEGPDRVNVSLSEITVDDQFPVFVDTGAGADHVDFGMHDMFVDGHMRVVLNTQAADDVLRTQIQRVAVNGALSIVADGGTGADALEFIIDWRVAAGALATWSALGGAGADAVSFIVNWHIAVGGRVESNLSGSEGADRLFGTGSLRTDGSLSMRLDGGDGNDVIRARLQFDSASRGSVDAAVFGGLGEDDLSLGIFGAERLALLSALMDGGRGYDIARITGNVLARNCEVVMSAE